MTPAEIQSFLLAHRPPSPVTPEYVSPISGRPSAVIMPNLVPGYRSAVPGSALDRAGSTANIPELLVQYDYDRRGVRIAEILAALDKRFGSLVYAPAAQIRSVIGRIDPVSRYVNTVDGSTEMPLLDPTTVPGIRKSFTGPGMAQVDPSTGLYDSSAGDPILSWSVHVQDTILWVAALP